MKNVSLRPSCGLHNRTDCSVRNPGTPEDAVHSGGTVALLRQTRDRETPRRKAERARPAEIPQSDPEAPVVHAVRQRHDQYGTVERLRFDNRLHSHRMIPEWEVMPTPLACSR